MTIELSKPRRGVPVLVWALVSAALLLFAGANAHLIYVAFATQPECVPHLKDSAGADGGFMAAKSAC